jgi:RNA polymerase sigma-70 factor, ECF subfamily
MTDSLNQVSELLVAWRDGSPEALDQLMPLVYDELRRVAHRYMNRQPDGQSLQTTALVHEAYVRLAGRDDVNWQNRAHFFGVCAQVMRNLLIDRARARQAAKRGGGAQQVDLEEAAVASPIKDEQLLALDEALNKLAALDPRKSQIVELRYFGGMSVDETAKVLNLSPITIKREWLKAKLFLYEEINKVTTSEI